MPQAMLKILMVSDDIPALTLGGLGKHVVRLGNYLIQQGHHVDIMGRSDIDFEPCREEVGFDGRFIPGFAFDHFNFKEGKSGVFMPGKRSYIARRIARAILRIADQYDVIHYHGHYPMIGRYIPAHINFVQTRHDQGSDCLIHLRFKQGAVCTTSDPRACAGCAPNAQPGRLREQVSAFAARLYRQHTAQSFTRHKTIFVSEFLRQAYLRHVPQTDPRNLHVVHNFIDTQVLPAPQSGDVGHVLFVGRIDEAKGVMALLDELDRLDTSAIQVDIIGDGPYRAVCEARHAAPNVRFHGWQLQADALASTARAGRIVVPSVLEESCGTTILEGLALDKPVYALARGGTPELKCYERWPGQLHLFDNMAVLARALVGDARTALPMSLSGEFGADIHLLADEILRLYRLPAA
jgi:glycosyltransferase involved in cell wall biosynthesis